MQSLETKQCKYCKSEIDKRAKVCPVCKRSLRNRGCLFIFGIILVLGVFGATLINYVLQDNAIQRSISGTSDDSEYITMDEYNSIKSGMTYEEVSEIVGSNGEVSSQVETSGITVMIITWYGNGGAGSNANVTFTNNEVTGKAQVGLK